MKSLLLIILSVFVGSLAYAAASAAVSQWTPVVLTVTGAPHPKVRIVAVDAEAGTFLFQWLNSDEEAVDSGNSIGRFTPIDAPAEDEPRPFPSNETLTAAVQAAAS